MRKSYKGLYRPTNPKKYVGDVNRIVYRSLLERKFMLYCDRNPDITYWASEELAIRYYNPLDKKYHRYYPDFIVRTVKGDKILIEIKPSRQTKPPKTPLTPKTPSAKSVPYYYHLLIRHNSFLDLVWVGSRLG